MIRSMPVFQVRDVKRSESFYCDKLGFVSHGCWGEGPDFCIVQRGRVTIALDRSRGDGRIRGRIDAPAGNAEIPQRVIAHAPQLQPQGVPGLTSGDPPKPAREHTGEKIAGACHRRGWRRRRPWR